MTIVAATDGSALGNPGPAGWAWYIDDDHWASGGWPHGTNNIGELTAVLDLLQQTAHADEPLTIYCDSTYVINSVTKWAPGWKRNGWRKKDGKPVLNVDIIRAIDTALQGRSVEFVWVKGHAGHALNEAADVRANAAATACRDGLEPDSGPGFPGAASPAPIDAWDEPDLFSDLETEPSDEDQVVAGERALRDSGVRRDGAALAALLHHDWCEIDGAGRVLTRDEFLAAPPVLDDPRIDILSVTAPTADCLLVLSRAMASGGPSVRSALWVRDGRRWVQRLQHATPER